MKLGWFRLFLVTILAASGMTSIASANTTGNLLFHDSFDTAAQIDFSKTTADVNTSQGWIDIECGSGANSIAASAQKGNLQNVVAVTQTGIEWFSFDQFTGKMVPLFSNTLTSYPDPRGVALAPDGTLYIYGQDSGQWYVRQALFDGAGLVDNPKMSVNFPQPISGITAISGTSFALADNTGKVTVYSYNSGSQTLQTDSTHSFSTGMTDIATIKSIPNTWDFYIITKTGSYRYSYDQSSGTNLVNPFYTISSSQLVAGDGSGSLLALLDGTASKMYGFDQNSYKMTEILPMSIASLSGAFSVSMPDDSLEVVASKDGSVQTYQYDSASSQMVANQNLEITGLAFSSQCVIPSIYQSRPIAPGAQNNMVEIVPSEQNDAGTSISYSLSGDGGTTFTPVSPNTWTHLPSGTKSPPSGANVPTGPFVVQAQLNSASDTSTPRLEDAQLYGYLDVTPPSQPGTPYGIPDPSYSTTTFINWSPSVDSTQSPSTGASGIARYFIRYSTDNGSTWSNWTDTKSNSPGYNLSSPANTAIHYLLQVMAEDVAGNESSPSSIGSLFVDTIPLGIVPGPNGGKVTVTEISGASNGQTQPPTDLLPVHVMAGGEVTYKVKTTGNAQSVEVTYSDGLTQNLIPYNPPNSPNDRNDWVGYYYPSNQQTISLGAAQGSQITLQNIKITRPGDEFDDTSPLLIIDGSLSGGTPFIQPQLSK